jgi:hypothetical protein
MSQSPEDGSRTLVLRLSVPGEGVLRSLAVDIAGRVADYVGSRVPDAAELAAAVERVGSTVAPNGSQADITFEFRQIDGELLIEARSGGRHSEVRWPMPA